MIDLYCNIIDFEDNSPKIFRRALKKLNVLYYIGYDRFVIPCPLFNSKNEFIPLKAYYERMEDFKKYVHHYGNMNIRFEYATIIPYNEHPERYLRSVDALTIGSTSYVLVDLKDLKEYDDKMFVFLDELIESNYKPIIIYPEKLKYIGNDDEIIEKLIEKGVYGLISHQSLCGAFGLEIRNNGFKMFREGFGAFIASDIINCDRQYELARVTMALNDMFSQTVTDAFLIENPYNVLRGFDVVGVTDDANERFSFRIRGKKY